MANDIISRNNWEVFKLSEGQQKFTQFIDMISKLEDGDHKDGWVKWKDYNNQVVISTPNYVYKIYCNDYITGRFFSEIREKLAEIYRNDFGIYWDIKTVYTQDCIYQFEQREKLQVLSEDIMPFDDVMVSWSKTLKKLEEKLLLPKIVKQLNNNVSTIKLVRECVNKYDDYAITKNGDVILLDDADWFLAPLDKDGNWISLKYNAYNVLSILGESYFCPLDYSEVIKNNILLQVVDENVNKWTLIECDRINGKSTSQFIDFRNQMLMDNIKVLNTEKPLDNKQLYYEKFDGEMLLIENNQALISSK